MEKKKIYEYICGDLVVKIPFTNHEMLASDMERIADIFKDEFLMIVGSEISELKNALENEDFEVEFSKEYIEENNLQDEDENEDGDE